MNGDDKTEAAIRRADSADRLLKDPLLTEAFDKVEAGIIVQMKADRLEAEDALRLALSLKLVGKVRAALLGYIGTGQIAKFDLREKQLVDLRRKDKQSA